MAGEGSSRQRLTAIARIGVFSALAYGINAPFLVIPNVEIFSLILFLSGVFLGVTSGIAVSLIAGFIFVFFNPNGPQTILPVGAAQLLGFVLYGLAGGLIRRILLIKYSTKKALGILVAMGAALTLWYDFSTNLVFAILFGPFWPVLIGGIAFGITHLISNVLIFGLSSLIIGKIWKRIEFLMQPLAG